MKSSRSTAGLILMFVLAAGAGVVAGKLTLHNPNPTPPTSAARRATLSEELSLNDDQQEKMRRIWEIAKASAGDCASEASGIQREYDDAVLALLSDENKVRYKQLSEQTKEKVKAVQAKREAVFQSAVSQTNKILTPPQQETYKQILNNRVGITGAGPGIDRGSEDASTPPATR